MKKWVPNFGFPNIKSSVGRSDNLTPSAFFESISSLKIIASTFIGFSLSLLLAGLLLRIKQPKPIVINSIIIVLVIALPFDLSNNLEAPLLSGDWLSVSERVYYLLKSLILYFPLGMIVAIAGADSAYKNLAFNTTLGFLITCLPLLGSAPGTALLNILAVPLGVNLGFWLMQDKRPEYA